MLQVNTNYTKDINQLISLHYDELRLMAYKLAEGKSVAEDLLHDALEAFLLMPHKRQQAAIAQGSFKTYMWGIIRTQYLSTSSKHFETYTRYDWGKVDTDVMRFDSEDVSDDDTELMIQIAFAINAQCGLFEKQLLAARVIDGRAYSDIAEEYGVSTAEITKVIKGIISNIKTEVQQ